MAVLSSYVPNILLVEDNPGDVSLFIEILRLAQRPAKLVIQRDGEDGIKYINNINEVNRPDLIVLDINLPKKNGLEVLAFLRSIEDLKSIPAVMLTSSHDKSDKELSFKLGANDYIYKTYEIDEYIEMVKSIYKSWLGFDT